MADIFISYAREDRETAKLLAECFSEQGWSVWFDLSLTPGEVFDVEIQEELERAKCVVVLWSRHSVGSEYVLAEAEEGKSRHVLVPVAFDDSELPLGFRRRQTLRLTAGNLHGGPGLDHLMKTVAEKLSLPPPPETGPAWLALLPRHLRLLAIVGGLLAALAALGAAFLSERNAILTTAGLPRQLLIGLAALPLASAFLSFVLPFWLRKRRRYRLEGVTAESTTGKPSPFQIRPYLETPTDLERFVRADGAHEEVLAWLRDSTETFLYLTGVSGAGKTSLLNAYVLPHLKEDSEVRIVSLRSFQDPATTFRKTLRGEASEVFGSEAGLRGLRQIIENAASGSPRLRILLVLDQFEEYLLIHERDPARIRPLTDFLRSLHTQPIPGVRILLVLRSDYLGLLHGFEVEGIVPALRQDLNWREVSAFRERDAWEFLARSPLSPRRSLLRRIFQQIAEIEGTRGLVRPITLNMVGLILSQSSADRLGELTSRSGAGLLQEYVSSALNRPEVRGEAPRVLRPLVTRKGFRQARSVGEMSDETGLSPPAVRGCLLNLSGDGLVRRLDEEEDVWEVSHDFVARLILRVMGSWRRSIWETLRLASFPASLVLWAAIFLVLPSFVEPRVDPDRIVAKVTYSDSGHEKNLPSDLDRGWWIRIALQRPKPGEALPRGWDHRASRLKAQAVSLRADEPIHRQLVEGDPYTDTWVVDQSTFSDFTGDLKEFRKPATWDEAWLEARVGPNLGGNLSVCTPEYALDQTEIDWKKREFETLYGMPEGGFDQLNLRDPDLDPGDVIKLTRVRAALEVSVVGVPVAKSEGWVACVTSHHEDFTEQIVMVIFPVVETRTPL